MIVFLSRPDRHQASDSSLISRWGCARQPYLFELQRRDYQLISTNEDGSGNVVLRVAYDANLPLEILIGSEVYFASTLDASGNAGHYGEVGVVTSIATAVGAYHLLYTSTPAVVPSTNGGFLNVVSRQNYYTSIVMTLYDAVNNKDHLVYAKLKPGMNGKARFDASEYITSYLVKEAPTSYSSVNVRDTRVYGRFTLSYNEHWTGSSNIAVSDASNEYYFVDAVKQLKDQYGQNLLSHLPFPELFAPGAKFLTEFIKPTFFPGYPFDLWFIYPKELSTAPVTREEDELTFSGAALTTQSASLDISQRDGVNRLRLKETGYSAGTAQLDVYLKIYSGVQLSYFNDNYIEDGYFELDPPVPPDGITPYNLTEKKRVKIGTVCDRNPVYVCWKNRLGGFDYWLFSGNQFIDIVSKQTGVINQDPDDIQLQNYRSTILNTDQVERITCGASVAIEDLQGIKSIEASPAVYILTSASPVSWIRVKINPKEFRYQSKGTTADITVEFEYPETYTVSN